MLKNIKIKKFFSQGGFTRTPSFFAKKNLVQGFTLVETLVAVLIVSIVVAATFSAVQVGLQTASRAKNQTIAFYLAQDAFDFIRNLRDTEKLTDSNNGFLRFKNTFNSCDTTTNNNQCTVDTTISDISSCGGSNPCEPLKYNSTNGFYDYDTNSGTDSPFTRSVQINPINATEVEILVTVSWNQGSVPVSFTFSDLLLDWQ